jgi:hypothetical protein
MNPLNVVGKSTCGRRQVAGRRGIARGCAALLLLLVIATALREPTVAAGTLIDRADYPVRCRSFTPGGRSVVVWQRPDRSEVRAWTLDVHGQFATETRLIDKGTIFADSRAWRVAGIGCFNADDDTDILFEHIATGTSYIALMRGLIVASVEFLSPSTAWRVRGVEDFNNDGFDDVVIQEEATGNARVVVIDNAVRIDEYDLGLPLPTSLRIRAVGRLDDDDTPDIVFKDRVTNAIEIWLRGTGVRSTFNSTSRGWEIAAVGHYDADGRADILVQNSYTGQTDVAFMDGATELGDLFIGAPTGWTAGFPNVLGGRRPESVAFQIVASHSGKCLDVTDGSLQDGARLQQWECNGLPQQRFWITSLDGERFTVMTAAGKVLDGENFGQGSDVQQWSDLGGANQRWQLLPAGTDEYTIWSGNNKLLYVAGASASNGAPVRQTTVLGLSAQRWRLVPVTSSTEGAVVHIVAKHSGQCLTVDSATPTANGTPLVQRPCQKGTAQRFWVNPVGGGVYRVLAYGTKSLDVTGNSGSNLAPIQQWQYLNGVNQQWLLRADADGAFRLQSRRSSKVLDVRGGTTAHLAGTPVQQYDDLGAANQRWFLQVVTGP